jgi:hypothetical protein
MIKNKGLMVFTILNSSFFIVVTYNHVLEVDGMSLLAPLHLDLRASLDQVIKLLHANLRHVSLNQRSKIKVVYSSLLLILFLNNSCLLRFMKLQIVVNF